MDNTIFHQRIGLEKCINVMREPNPYSPGIDFIRQILTTKVNSLAVGVEIFLMAADP